MLKFVKKVRSLGIITKKKNLLLLLLLKLVPAIVPLKIQAVGQEQCIPRAGLTGGHILHLQIRSWVEFLSRRLFFPIQRRLLKI
jgi:hypothetical protein